jgi:virginiamycin B lyase
MWSRNKLLALLSGLVIFPSFSCGATISGTVRAPDGAPFEGAFIEAQNLETKMTVDVLSDRNGRYRFETLPAGEYSLRVKAIGYSVKPLDQVILPAAPNRLVDFGLQKDAVRWADLTIYQGLQLFPEGKGRNTFVTQCIGCHGFESRMASVRRDAEGWRDSVNHMRYTIFLPITDRQADDVVSYMTTMFSPNSTVPRNPAELPGYKRVEQHFSDEAMEIVYVEYELPGPGRAPWNSNPGKDGNVWIPYYSEVNGIARLDPKTGEVREFHTPSQPRVAIHSAVSAQDGTVWFAEQITNRLGHLDSQRNKVTEYQDVPLFGRNAAFPPVIPPDDRLKAGPQSALGGARHAVIGFLRTNLRHVRRFCSYVLVLFRLRARAPAPLWGAKHTVRIDSQGRIWATGSPVTRFDPSTGKFTEVVSVPSAYGIALDQEGDAWFADFSPHGKIGKIDPNTLSVTKWTPPTDGGPRRIEVDTDGMVWFTEYTAGKIGRFNPNDHTFREYTLPGPQATPYALGVNKDHHIWYSSFSRDIVGRLDPATGNVVEYPFPHPENTIRELNCDSQDRFWWASPANNKVGYFYLRPSGSAEQRSLKAQSRGD